MPSSVPVLFRRVTARAALAVVAVLLPALAEPCSICRCGDATFNALGKDYYAARGWHLAADWERFDKEEGDPAEESEAQVENRFTALASYGFGQRFTLLARLPVSVRNLEASAPGSPTETIHTSGLSDPEIYAQAQLWASQMTGSVGRARRCRRPRA